MATNLKRWVYFFIFHQTSLIIMKAMLGKSHQVNKNFTVRNDQWWIIESQSEVEHTEIRAGPYTQSQNTSYTVKVL